jgi:hypothetical protein
MIMTFEDDYIGDLDDVLNVTNSYQPLDDDDISL